MIALCFFHSLSLPGLSGRSFVLLFFWRIEVCIFSSSRDYLTRVVFFSLPPLLLFSLALVGRFSWLLPLSTANMPWDRWYSILEERSQSLTQYLILCPRQAL